MRARESPTVFPDNVRKYGQDIDGAALADAHKLLTNFESYEGDLLKNPGWIDRKFKAIVANPPFSIGWDPVMSVQFKDAPTIPTKGRADYAFLMHILYMLADDGTAAVLNFPGILYRGQREAAIRQWMVEQNVIQKVIHIPGGTFTDTSIATACLVLKKGLDQEGITFIDATDGTSIEVSYEEIAGNDFNLSVQRYIQREEVREEFDPIATEELARQGVLRRLRSELNFSKQVEAMSQIPFKPFLDQIQGVVNEFKEDVA